MKKATLYIAISFILTLLISSCEVYDRNGDLGGMWQMTQWEDKQSQTNQEVKEKNIYYCVQTKLMKFVGEGDFGRYHLAYFRHSKDSLVIYDVRYFPGDTLCPEGALTKKYGVPADGRFHIDKLDHNHLILSSGENTLSFRKR